MIQETSIGIIGYGNMGSAIAELIKSKYALEIFDKDANKIKNLSDIKVTKSIKELAVDVEIVVLAVKPQDLDSVLQELSNSAQGKLVISIVAGIETKHIEKILQKARVVRVMPNLGAKIGEAESSLCKGMTATENDLLTAEKLFNYLGKTWVINEQLIDAATAICGSGPAYIFYDMEKNNIDAETISEEKVLEYSKQLQMAAESVGFDPLIASQLAAATTGTSIDLVTMTGLSPMELRQQVTSRGGTTEAALQVLFVGGTWTDAAKAAKERAEKLSREVYLWQKLE